MKIAARESLSDALARPLGGSGRRLLIGARWLALTDLQPSLPTLTGIRSEYLKGITGQRLVVLDAKKLLADRSIVVNE